MFYVYWEDHYEPGEIVSEFENLENALDLVGRVRDDGGTAVCVDDDGKEYDI